MFELDQIMEVRNASREKFSLHFTVIYPSEKANHLITLNMYLSQFNCCGKKSFCFKQERIAYVNN